MKPLVNEDYNTNMAYVEKVAKYPLVIVQAGPGNGQNILLPPRRSYRCQQSYRLQVLCGNNDT